MPPLNVAPGIKQGACVHGQTVISGMTTCHSALLQNYSIDRCRTMEHFQKGFCQSEQLNFTYLQIFWTEQIYSTIKVAHSKNSIYNSSCMHVPCNLFLLHCQSVYLTAEVGSARAGHLSIQSSLLIFLLKKFYSFLFHLQLVFFGIWYLGLIGLNCFFSEKSIILFLHAHSSILQNIQQVAFVIMIFFAILRHFLFMGP